MPEPGEKDEQHQRLDQIKEHVDQARVAADHLAKEGVIEAHPPVEDEHPSQG